MDCPISRRKTANRANISQQADENQKKEDGLCAPRPAGVAEPICICGTDILFFRQELLGTINFKTTLEGSVEDAF